MSLNSLKSQFRSNLISASRFKNRFLREWEKYGEFLEVDGERYLRSFRIDGNSDGAIAMSKILGDPTLHNDIENSDLSSVDLVLNFNKLLSLDQSMIDDWLEDYKSRISSKSFIGLYYRISEQKVLTHYFYDADHNRIDDELLDELSFDLAERERVGYHDIRCNCIDFGVTIVDGTAVDQVEIVFDEDQSIEDTHSLMNRLDDINYLYTNGDYETVFTMPLIKDKILAYSAATGVGANDVFESFTYVDANWFSGYYISLNEAKRMNAKIFLKLIIEILDFDAHASDRAFWRKALTGIATVVVGGIYMFYTGDIYGGFAIMTGVFGEMMDDDGLKIISTVLSFGSIGMGESGGFALANIGYADALELVLNVGAIYYSMQNTPPKIDEESIDREDAVYLLYQAPYSIYDDLYEYEKVINVYPG